MTPLRVLVIGRGKVAEGLRRAATPHPNALTLRLRALSSVRPADLAWAEALLLTVPDAAIRASATSLAGRVGRVPVLHLSGNRPSDEANACREHGALHPLASFASRTAPPALAGVYFALGGTPRARRVGRQIAQGLGGRVLRGRSDTSTRLQGPAYHAAAALVANGAAALAASGVDILTHLGVTQASAQRAIAGLLRTVAHNVEHVGVPSALTGPVMRGDAATVREHRRALASLGGSSAEAYDAIARVIVVCAEKAGLPHEAAREVHAVLGDGTESSARSHTKPKLTQR